MWLIHQEDRERQRERDDGFGGGGGGDEQIPEHRTHNPEGVKRTRIPQAFNDTFRYVPKSSVDLEYERERGKEHADSSVARLTQKMNRKALNKR